MATRPLIVLLAVATIAAGCGGDDGDDRQPSPQPPAEEMPDTPAPEPDGPEIGDGRGGVELERIADLDQPLHLTQPPAGDDALYVVEQCGRIVRLAPGREPSTFLDLAGEVSCGGEQGLLSVAFHPRYERNGRLYVNFTDTAGDTRVVEYRRADGGATADPESGRELLGVPQPFSNHNGGLVLFGPDGHLYVGLGDGGSAGDPERTALDLDSLLGKLLRIDPRPGAGGPYRIPDANPFAGGGEGRPEIVAYGLRNPWRFSFDRETGELWIADVGQDALEEINGPIDDVDRGPSFGWSAFEGSRRFNEDQRAPDQVPPALEYSLDGPECAVTGGFVVRDPAVASLYGRYLYGDFCTGELRSFVPAGGDARDDRALGPEVPALSSFGEDAKGRVYATSLEGGVYRLRGE